MFETEKEKRKGRPRRTRLMTVAALLCGPCIALIVFFLTSPQKPAEFLLADFEISESQNQIALSWWNGTTGIWATREWTTIPPEYTITQLQGGTEGEHITELAYQGLDNTLMTLSSNDLMQLRSKRDGAFTVQSVPDVVQAVYSANGQFLALLRLNQGFVSRIEVFQMPLEDVLQPTYIISPGFTSDITLSPDGAFIALTDLTPLPNSDPERAQMIRVLKVGDSTEVQTFYLPLTQSSASVEFNSASTELAVAVDGVVYRLNLQTGMKQALSQASMPMTTIDDLVYSPDGRWLAVVGNSDEFRGAHLYDLRNSDSAAPEMLSVWTTPVIKGQFLSRGFVIGEMGQRLTFWKWTEEGWTKTGDWDVAW